MTWCQQMRVAGQVGVTIQLLLCHITLVDHVLAQTMNFLRGDKYGKQSGCAAPDQLLVRYRENKQHAQPAFDLISALISAQHGSKSATSRVGRGHWPTQAEHCCCCCCGSASGAEQA